MPDPTTRLLLVVAAFAYLTTSPAQFRAARRRMADAVRRFTCRDLPGCDG